MFEIQKNRPLPGETNRINWPWKRMAVGDSVTIPRAMVRSAINSANAYFGRYGATYTRMKTGQDEWTFWRKS